MLNNLFIILTGITLRMVNILVQKNNISPACTFSRSPELFAHRVFPALEQDRMKHCNETHAESIGDLTCLERHTSTGVTSILLHII